MATTVFWLIVVAIYACLIVFFIGLGRLAKRADRLQSESFALHRKARRK